MTIPPHAHYVVKLEVYADPTLPDISADDLEEMDYARRMQELLAEMEGLSSEELEDSVHWRREFRICRSCQRALLKNPLGAENAS